MHTADLMKTSEFAFTKEGLEARFFDILPNFKPGDRIGVASVHPGDSLKAAPLLLAAVGAYYETLRESETDFYLYPDFFIFHVGELQCYHSALDIWPQSKEVVVPEDPQALLAAINDRGVHHLILPDVDRTSGTVMLQAVHLARRRLKNVLTVSENNGDVSVTPSDAAARMIRTAVRRSASLLGEEVTSYWTENVGAGRQYSYTTAEDALSIICSVGDTDPFFGFDERYRGDCGITETTLARDSYQVVPAG